MPDKAKLRWMRPKSKQEKGSIKGALTKGRTISVAGETGAIKENPRWDLITP